MDTLRQALAERLMGDIDLAYDPAEKRDSKGRWTDALDQAIAGDTDALEALVQADRGPTRITMPQLSGVPLPGSKAAETLKPPPGAEVDLTSQFEKELQAAGVSVQETQVKISDLKPTQDELVGSTVAGLAKFMLHAPANSPVWEPIFVSADNHVIDGHHRWAARTVRAKIDGTPDETMAVRRIGLNIADALPIAVQFMDEWGLPRAGMANRAVVSHFAPAAPSLSNVDLAAHDVTAERRDSHGRWADTLGAAKVAELSEAGVKALGSAKGPNKEFGNFAWQQQIAQRIAERAYRHNEVADGQGLYDNPDVLMEMKDCPERSWGVYQMDGGYQAINDVLRDNEPPQYQGTLIARDLKTTRQALADNMVKAFDTMGFTTQKPGVLYRTVDGDHFPLESMTPGTVYQDTGVISCAASATEVAGLLDPPDDLVNSVDMRRPNPILLRINVPAGTRVLGGAPGGIETMMKPGTKFRVVEVKSKTTIGGVGEPGYMGYIGKHSLPQVTLEVLP